MVAYNTVPCSRHRGVGSLGGCFLFSSHTDDNSVILSLLSAKLSLSSNAVHALPVALCVLRVRIFCVRERAPTVGRVRAFRPTVPTPFIASICFSDHPAFGRRFSGPLSAQARLVIMAYSFEGEEEQQQETTTLPDPAHSPHLPSPSAKPNRTRLHFRFVVLTLHVFFIFIVLWSGA